MPTTTRTNIYAGVKKYAEKHKFNVEATKISLNGKVQRGYMLTDKMNSRGTNNPRRVVIITPIGMRNELVAQYPYMVKSAMAGFKEVRASDIDYLLSLLESKSKELLPHVEYIKSSPSKATTKPKKK
jgi:hypothetical protein